MRRRKYQERRAEVRANSTPLKVSAAGFATHDLQRPSDDLLILAPRRVTRLIAIAILVAGIVLLLWAVTGVGLEDRPLSSHRRALFVWGIGLVGAVFFVAGILGLILPDRLEFDRARQELRCKRLRRRVYPLSSISAIQLLPGGWHGREGAENARYFTYQLNLVFHGEKRARMSLTNHSNWDITLAMASELAEFLEVPLLDEAS